MKIAKKVLPASQPKEVCPLPLVPDEDESTEEKDTTKYGTFKLLTDPGTAGCPKYTFTMKYIDGTQNLRAVLNWIVNVKKVCAGLNLTTAAEQVPLIRQMCLSNALAIFDASIEQSRRCCLSCATTHRSQQCASH